MATYVIYWHSREEGENIYEGKQKIMLAALKLV